MKRLTVLHPQASRTGSTRSLLFFLKWLSKAHQGSFDVESWFFMPGSMDFEFSKLGAVRLLTTGQEHAQNPFVRGLARYGYGPWFLKRRLFALTRSVSDRPGVTLNHTCANQVALGAIPKGERIVTFVHETEATLAEIASVSAVEKMILQSARLLVPSQATATNLARRYKAPEEKIRIIPGWLAETPIKMAEWISLRDLGRQRLGVPRIQPMVVGCGYEHWIKGPDIFLEIAHRLKSATGLGGVRFIWIGAQTDGATSKFLRAFARHLGVDDTVSFVGEVDDVRPVFAAADVFLCTSRAESFGLAPLEAAAVGCPIVYFSGCGDLDRCLHPPLGFPVISGDLGAMASRVADLLHTRGDISGLIDAAANLVAAHSVEMLAPAVYNELIAVAAGR